jgi:hypothetical protein
MIRTEKRGHAMSGPFIFVATNRLKYGKLEAEREEASGGLMEFASKARRA